MHGSTNPKYFHCFTFIHTQADQPAILPYRKLCYTYWSQVIAYKRIICCMLILTRQAIYIYCNTVGHLHITVDMEKQICVPFVLLTHIYYCQQSNKYCESTTIHSLYC